MWQAQEYVLGDQPYIIYTTNFNVFANHPLEVYSTDPVPVISRKKKIHNSPLTVSDKILSLGTHRRGDLVTWQWDWVTINFWKWISGTSFFGIFPSLQIFTGNLRFTIHLFESCQKSLDNCIWLWTFRQYIHQVYQVVSGGEDSLFLSFFLFFWHISSTCFLVCII